jgi:hypothetical protein
VATIETLGPGLWRWTTPHPRWRPEYAGPGGWDEQVASVAFRARGVLAVVDPLLPARPEPVLAFLDEAASGREVVVLLTASWHERSAAAVQERYGARVCASASANVGCNVTDRIGPGAEVLGDVLALPLGGGGGEAEIDFHLVTHRALVVAEVFVGTAEGLRVALSPIVESLDGWRDSVGALAALDVERVLPAHGPPVLCGGRLAMQAALARPEWNSEGRLYSER